jgi:8-oxo-dGTP pyrophosphatase MutT (NUDIX family)
MGFCRSGYVRRNQRSSKLSNPKKLAVRRIQYAALPFRCNLHSGVEVMLVTSRDTGRWVIPKGWPIAGEAPHASAAREALEEAGVVGEAGKDSIGTFTYAKRLSNGAIVICEVRVFPLEVKHQRTDHWPEREEREVRWFSLSEAAKAVQEAALSDIILGCEGRQGTSITLFER